VSIGIGVMAAIYLIMATSYDIRFVILNFWGANTEFYLLLLIIGITILVSIGAFYLKKRIPVMLAELEKLRYGQTKSIYINSKKLSEGIKPKSKKFSFAKEEYKPRAHNFMTCPKCSKLNKNTNQFCDECGSELKK
jgi:hypothetical protein